MIRYFVIKILFVNISSFTFCHYYSIFWKRFLNRFSKFADQKEDLHKEEPPTPESPNVIYLFINVYGSRSFNKFTRTEEVPRDVMSITGSGFLGTWNSLLSTRSENFRSKRAGGRYRLCHKFITQERKFWWSPQTIALPRMPQFANYKDVSHGLICGRRRSLIVLHRSFDRDACQQCLASSVSACN